jgi:transcriptional regulator with XRE-family HTH domain
MRNSGLGQLVRARRQQLALSQRQLAAMAGVKASHIAYIEGNQRRPSMNLLGRLADVLGFDQERLLRLSHPEAAALLKPITAKSRHRAWKAFTGNKALIRQHSVTPKEMDILQRINLLGKVSTPRHFLIILNTIRLSIDGEP